MTTHSLAKLINFQEKKKMQNNKKLLHQPNWIGWAYFSQKYKSFNQKAQGQHHLCTPVVLLPFSKERESLPLNPDFDLHLMLDECNHMMGRERHKRLSSSLSIIPFSSWLANTKTQSASSCLPRKTYSYKQYWHQGQRIVHVACKL